MKSLKDYSMNLSEQEYHDYPAWSYSLIAKYAKDGFGALATLHDKTEPTPSMRFGSLFDSIITKGKKTLDEYAVMDCSVPESERRVLDYLHQETTLPFDEIPIEVFTTATEKAKYRSNWKPETRYNTISTYKSYYETLRSGKKLVSSEDWADAMEMNKAFRANPVTGKLFGTKNTEDIEYIYQAQFLVPWFIEGEDVNIKIMPDLLVVNHKDKTIQPVDLKTSSQPAYEFAENFLKFRYDIQAELYSDVIEKVICGIEDYYDYTVLPFIFADISRSDKVPVTYIYDPKKGLSFSNGDRFYSYKGWQELLAEILVYQANEAKVPDYISVDTTNDLLEILTRK